MMASLPSPDYGNTGWDADGSEIETALIITTTPNREISEIHDRMPVIDRAGGL